MGGGIHRSSKKLIFVYNRDKGICHLCDQFVKLEEASLDHVIPRWLGGRQNVENLALSHKNCNHRRGSLELKEFREIWHSDWPQHIKTRAVKLRQGQITKARNLAGTIYSTKMWEEVWRCEWCGNVQHSIPSVIRHAEYTRLIGYCFICSHENIIDTLRTVNIK